jgi:catechol 2,3-dioxygenase-like lactoylglutathione lyase family enzyme
MPSTIDKQTTYSRIKIKRVIHTIHAVIDIAACRAKYLDVLGGLIFAEGYFEPEDRDMALLYVADYMIEPMAPRDAAREDKPFARYLRRYGQRWHSFEIQVENGPELSTKLKAAGYKLAADYGFFFFVRAESTGGVLLEVSERPMPNDPYDRRGWRSEWSEGHKSSLLRLDHIACVTRNLEAVIALFTGQLDGELVADERISVPQPARRIWLRLADTKVAFTQPDDASGGPLGRFLAPPTTGIYALVWHVEEEAVAEAFFQQKGLRTTRDNCLSSGFAIEPADFLGARHEFFQERQFCREADTHPIIRRVIVRGEE